MGNGSETVVKISPDNPTDKPAIDKPKFESLTLEERAWLVARLEALRHRGLRENPAWKAELVVVLKSTPILEPIKKMLEADDLSSSQPTTQAAFEQKITQVIEAALRVVSASSAPALGDGLRYLVAQEVEKVIWQSQTVKVMRWGAVALAGAFGAALLGGTIWGTYKVDGLNTLINTARDDATKAQESIRNLRDDAQKKIDEQIQKEVDARTKKLDDMFVDVQKKADTGATDKLKAFDQALGTLNSDYTGKSQTAFKVHNEATDKLWETQDQNWVKAPFSWLYRKLAG
jgi:hypothetical protein